MKNDELEKRFNSDFYRYFDRYEYISYWGDGKEELSLKPGIETEHVEEWHKVLVDLGYSDDQDPDDICYYEDSFMENLTCYVAYDGPDTDNYAFGLKVCNAFNKYLGEFYP